MDFNTTLDSIINNVNSNQDTLRSLLAQLQHTTITSSDDELYEAPTHDEETGIWTLSQSTANVDGLFVGCYKLPATDIDSYINSITVIDNTYTAPTLPTAPATVTPSGDSPVDLINVADLEGRAFNSFCIRSATAFEITLRVSADEFLADKYEVWLDFGTEVGRGSDYIIVQSAVSATAGIACAVRAIDKDICCFVTHEIISGDATNPQIFYSACGEEPNSNSFLHSRLGGGGCDSSQARNSLTAFTTKFIFTPCP